MAELLVNIDVDDLERGVDFYTRAFELTAGRRFGKGAVELLGAKSTLFLLAKERGSAAFERGEARRYERHWTPVHLDFVVDDLDAAIARALDAGARQELEVGHYGWGDVAQFSDPFGHGFCLVKFSARGYDALLDAAG